MGLYKGENEYMKALVKAGAKNIKKEFSRWSKMYDGFPGKYGKEPLMNYRGSFSDLFMADDEVKSPFRLYNIPNKDESYSHAANMLANQVHEFLSLPGVKVNIPANASLEEAIKIITCAK